MPRSEYSYPGNLHYLGPWERPFVKSKRYNRQKVYRETQEIIDDSIGRDLSYCNCTTCQEMNTIDRAYYNEISDEYYREIGVID